MLVLFGPVRESVWSDTLKHILTRAKSFHEAARDTWINRMPVWEKASIICRARFCRLDVDEQEPGEQVFQGPLRLC